MSTAAISQEALAQLFEASHTEHGFTSAPVSDELLKAVYDSMKFAPTAFNCSPARIYFIRSAEQKEKLLKCLMPGNVPQTTEAPVTAIIAYDSAFVPTMDKLSPNYDAKGLFEANPSWVEPTAVLNGTIQAGYFILAARAHGLGAGPMSGFDKAAVDAAFFEGTTLKSNILVNLGYGDASKRYPRAPRLDFEEATKIL